MDDTERLRIVVKHLVEHSQGHAEDHKRWVEVAKTNGLDQVAALITEASAHMAKAADVLTKALEHLGGAPDSGHGHHHHHHDHHH